MHEIIFNLVIFADGRTRGWWQVTHTTTYNNNNNMLCGSPSKKSTNATLTIQNLRLFSGVIEHYSIQPNWNYIVNFAL